MNWITKHLSLKTNLMASPLSRYAKYLILLSLLKLLLMVLFSSDYQNKLFMPFVEHFLSNIGGNPWQYFYQSQADKFPYPPMMLYITSLLYLPINLFADVFNTHIIFRNLFFKLPTVMADIVIFVVLLKMFPNNIKETLIYYFASPIIIYASYMHSQLDLIPMAILTLSVYLMTKNRLILSAVAIGIAMSTKFHVVAALPLMIVYVINNYKRRYAFYFIFIPIAIYLLVASPFLFSEGYYYMVLRNPKQMAIFDVIYSIGNLKIYVTIFSVIAIYLRFFAYRKINNDLLYTFLGILFSAFVLLIFPAPGWYIWMVPFLSIFFIKHYKKNPIVLYLYLTLNIAYLVYFLFFNIFEYNDLIFYAHQINIKLHDEKLRNISYTALEVMLCATLYALYTFGVKSNRVYKKGHGLVIGIGGDSASGKSTLLHDIRMLLGEKLLAIEGDADHKWARSNENWQTYTHLDPRANNLHRQVDNLLALKLGTNIKRRDYDHNIGDFTKPNKLSPGEFTALSGLHPFYLPLARKIIDIKIFLDTEERLRCYWKTNRDVKERGYSREKIEDQIKARIDDAKKYIYPQKEFADLVVSYYSEDDLDSGTQGLQFRLKVTMDSSIHLEYLVEKFLEENIDLSWDYADDLKNQHLVLKSQPDKEIIQKIAREIIPNIEEIATNDAGWLNGQRGFVQLIVLLMISRKMRVLWEYNEC